MIAGGQGHAGAARVLRVDRPTERAGRRAGHLPRPGTVGDTVEHGYGSFGRLCTVVLREQGTVVYGRSRVMVEQRERERSGCGSRCLL